MRPGKPSLQNLKITSQKVKLQDDLYHKYRCKNPRQILINPMSGVSMYGICVNTSKPNWVY